jgi:hypothetical protein
MSPLRAARRRVLPALLLGLAAVAFSPAAAAYCRKTTNAPSDPSYDPSATGVCGDGPHALPLYWAHPCIEYRITVADDLVEADTMTQARAREIVHRAAAAWEGARCDGAAGGPRIRLVDVADARCATATERTTNEVRFVATPAQGAQLAVTDVSLGPDNGAILGATTRIFDVIATLGATPDETDPKVEYIVRHELGHFLGLAHSEDTGAVMYARFQGGTDALTEDDRRAICDAYDPQAPTGAGCRAAPGGPVHGRVVAALLVGLGLLVRRRRRMLSAALAVGVMLGSTAARAEMPIPTVSVDALPKAAAGKPTRRVARPKKAASAAVVAASVPAPATIARAEASDAPSTAPERTAIPRAPAPIPDAPAAASVPASKRADVYLGGRYRAFVVPQAALGLFASGGKNLVFQSMAIELDVRRASGLSIVPAVSFADLSTGDMVLGKRGDDRVSSFSYVRSDLTAIAGSVELAWSLPVSAAVDVELGLELGVGFTLGTFADNWVFETPSGPLAYGTRRFAPCQSVNDGVGCRPQDHASPVPVKVGGATEKSLFAGGKTPSLLPWVSLPLVGVRIKVGDDAAMRLGVGASATGFWAGVSAGYLVARAR